MGRFLSPDPLGYRDGPSGYSLTSANPLAKTDSLGLYAEDGHFYTVFLVALYAGLPASQAEELAFFAQLPDEVTDLDAIEAFRQKWAGNIQSTKDRRAGIRLQRYLHALTGTSSIAESNWTSYSISVAPSVASAGFMLHRLGDTFSHRTLKNESRLYNRGAGHGLDLTEPDIIQRRPNLYLDYVEMAANALLERFASELGVEAPGERTARARGVRSRLGAIISDAAIPRFGTAPVGQIQAASIRTFRRTLDREIGYHHPWRPELFEIDHYRTWTSQGRVTTRSVLRSMLAARPLGLDELPWATPAQIDKALSEAMDTLLPVP